MHTKDESKPRLVAPGTATYKGDVSQTVVGQIMGPRTYGDYVTAIATVYDPDTDTTRVKFSPTTMEVHNAIFTQEA